MLSALGPIFVVLVAVTAVFVNFSLHRIEEGEQKSHTSASLTDHLMRTSNLSIFEVII